MLTTDTLRILLPEILLAAVATAIYVAGSFGRGRGIWSWIGGAGIIASAIVLRQIGIENFVNGPLSGDALAVFVRWLALAIGLLFVMLTAQGASQGQTPEIVGSLLLAVVGMMLVAVSQDLVMLFVGLELISIPTYLLLYLGGCGSSGQEATTKYFFLSILASAVLLYGFSFLYGVTGSTHLGDIYARLNAMGSSPAGLGGLTAVALVMIFAGLAFKIAAVPFHFYAPDVYQGTSNANAGLLSVMPKVGGMIALVRLVGVGMQGLMDGQNSFGWSLALIVAALTMTLGNVMALWQDNLRRLLAYSSIAHAGYMLVGLAVTLAVAGGAENAPGFDGIGAVLIYLAVYSLATTGTFAALTYLGRKGRQVEGIDDLAGLGQTHPLTGVALAVFMLSLAGIPPLAGFFGKFMLLTGAVGIDVSIADSAMRPWFLMLAIVGVINAVIGAAYYLRVIVVTFFRAPRAQPAAEGGLGALAATVAAMILVVAFGVYPTPLMRGAARASQAALSLFGPAAAKAVPADSESADSVPAD
jgi:NADH-quinone oxidoreductase subunit N